jgi:hypothetical protein
MTRALGADEFLWLGGIAGVIAWLAGADDVFLGLSGLAFAGWGTALSFEVGRTGRGIARLAAAVPARVIRPRVIGGVVGLIGLLFAVVGFLGWL